MQQKILQDLREINFTAIDFETANEKRHSACSIGIVRVEHGHVVERQQYLIRPKELRVEPINYSIHRISLQMLRPAPELPELWSRIEPFIAGQLVVAHNAAFDISVLRHTLLAYALPEPAFHSMCSIKLIGAAFPHIGLRRLNDLAAHFALTLDHHDSLSDAAACAALTLRALRSGHPFPFTFKKQDITTGFGRQTSAGLRKKSATC
jgi:DNA polymerase-3 subunit epsilon